MEILTGTFDADSKGCPYNVSIKSSGGNQFHIYWIWSIKFK